MRISHDVRNCAAEHGLGVEKPITVGLDQKAIELIVVRGPRSRRKVSEIPGLGDRVTAPFGA